MEIPLSQRDRTRPTEPPKRHTRHPIPTHPPRRQHTRSRKRRGKRKRRQRRTGLCTQLLASSREGTPRHSRGDTPRSCTENQRKRPRSDRQHGPSREHRHTTQHKHRDSLHSRPHLTPPKHEHTQPPARPITRTIADNRTHATRARLSPDIRIFHRPRPSDHKVHPHTPMSNAAHRSRPHQGRRADPTCRHHRSMLVRHAPSNEQL
jgi:hypothetical protein